MLGLLLEKMSRDVPFKESRTFLLSSSPDRVATLLPLAVSAVPLPPPHWRADPTGGLGTAPRGTWQLPGAPEPASSEPSLVKAPQMSVPKGDPSVSSFGKINLAWQQFQQ